MITNISDHKGVKILSYNNFNFNGKFNLSTKQLFASWSLWSDFITFNALQNWSLRKLSWQYKAPDKQAVRSRNWRED